MNTTRIQQTRLAGQTAVVLLWIGLAAALTQADDPVSSAKSVSIQSPDTRRPNIIFIVTDDHGYNDLEATDLRGEVSMPNVNRLSTGGALMTQAYCTAPQCVPSRAGIVTGRYQQRFGIDANQEGPLPTTQKSIAARLKGLGYTTGHVGKWHLDINRGTKGWLQKNGYKSVADVPPSVLNSFKPQGFGYDDFSAGPATRVWCNFDVTGNSFSARDVDYRTYEGNSHQEKHRIQLQTEHALAFINRHVDQPDPFFLYVGYYGPHVPLGPPSNRNVPALTKRYQQLDSNGDGKLLLNELKN